MTCDPQKNFLDKETINCGKYAKDGTIEKNETHRILSMMDELKELLHSNRDVELKQLLDKIDSNLRSICKKETKCNAEIQQLSNEHDTLSTRLNSLARDLDLEQHPLTTLDSRSSFPSEGNLQETLQEERKTQASLKNHLNDFQSVLEQVRAENRSLILRLSQYETEAIAARHNWLITEAELKQRVDQLLTRVRECESANVSLRNEVVDAHQRAALIVRDTHQFLSNVRTGLHKFVRELRSQGSDTGDSMDKCPSLREMLHLIQGSAKSINASSDGWMEHLKDDKYEDRSESRRSTATSTPSKQRSKDRSQSQSSLTKKKLHNLDAEFEKYQEPIPSSLACHPDDTSIEQCQRSVNKKAKADGNHVNSPCLHVLPKVCLNSISEKRPVKDTQFVSPTKTRTPKFDASHPKISLPLMNTDIDDPYSFTDTEASTITESTWARNDSSKVEDESMFRQHLEILDCKLANLQTFMKQTPM